MSSNERWRAAREEREREAEKLWLNAVRKWSPIFKRHGFDGHDIDFSSVKPEAIEAMGSALLALENNELFGLSDMEQWAVYRRDDKSEAARTVFSVWDSGARTLFSGMEVTRLFTRQEAESRLVFMVLDTHDHSYEINSLRRALGAT